MKVYFDGEEQSQTPAMKKHNEISQLSIPAGTRVVAIECQNLGGGYGILASTSTGLKTDTFWRCSSKMIEDWTKPSFVYPPETFASPKILGNNDGARPGIMADAKRIWSSGSKTWAYCRIEIGG